MKIEVDQLPEELARALFEALRLEIRYNRDTHTATCRVTLTGPTITAASRTAHDAAVISLDDARQRRQVQYGLRDNDTAPASGKVVFDTADRCVPGSQCSFEKPENWPDVPLGERCGATDCKDHYSPTFWSAKRLAKITTKVRKGTDYADVDSWTLEQTYPDPGDGEKAALWLKGITHTGLVGTPITLPAVSFEGKKLANRADKGDASDGIGPLNRYRLSAIVSESGGVTTINYAAADCGPGALPDKPETNTKRCYPATWSKRNYAERTDYFNKYVVASVVQSDRISSSTEQVTNYEYPDGAAWHFSTSEFTPEDKKTWDDFRGFGRVIVRTGKPDDLTGPTSYAESRYYRGMNGDKLPNGGTRTVALSDSEGGTHADEDWLRGFPLESITKNGENGPVVSKSITDPSWTGPTATRGAFNAYLVHPGTERTFTALAAGGWRTAKVSTEYDQYGLPTKVNDLGDVNAADDDRCTTTTYAQNTALWLIQFASRVETTAVNCGQTPQYPRDTISDTRTSYDTRGDGTPQANGTPPTKGDITLAEEIDHYDGAAPRYRTVATTTYDVHGRATAVTDADGNTTKSTYTPATGGPVTQLVLTNALNQKTTRVYEPAWGTPRTVTDLNNWVTESTYDALGRTTEVWAPNRLRSSNPQGSVRYSYDVRNDKPSAVSTTRIGPNGNFTTSTTILDSLYRTRQVQTPAPGGGRLLVDARYDSHGRTFKTTQPFYNDQPVDTDLWVADDTEIPGFTSTEFDGAERPVAAIYKTGATERWRTTTTYGGDRTSVTPPGGGTPTTTITDARGHTRSLRQYHGAEPSGDYDETAYTYTPAGQLAGVTDSSSNHWSYGYDLHGLVNQAVDPDRGTTTYTYDKLNQLATSTDARNVTLAYSYDHLGRKTGLYQGSTIGPKLAEWAYDTAFKGVGQLASATRWVNGNAYVQKVYAYSPLGQPSILGTIIPSSEGPQLAGTYQTNTTYAPDGTLGGASIPKAGDLPVESMLYVHDDLGNPTITSGGINNGTEQYVTASDYTKYGELQRLELGTSGHRAWLSSYYDTNTRRLDRTIVDAEVAHPMQADTHYTAPCSTDPAITGLGGPARYWQSFTYDKSGNRTADTQHNATGDVTRRYTYAAPGTPKPHILNSVTSSGPAGTTQYTYDEVGNTKTRPGATAQQTLDWDTENRLDTVTEGSSQTSFLYDADGGRLIRRDPAGTTLYLGDQEVRVDKQSGIATTTRYYSHGGAMVAVRTDGKLSWLAGDHQGTTQVAIDTADLTVRQRRQAPFGSSRGANGGLPGERGFVGGTMGQATGLTHLGARDFDADLGRFASLDPILNPADPQQINGYSYANNSPISFSDPSGLIIQMDGRPPGSTRTRSTA